MIQSVRGMRDIHGEEVAAWQRIERIFQEQSHAFGYSEFRTPMVEFTELFKRGVGESSDIVGKEMYTFDDRGGDSITLRPEMTAPIVRAAIEHNLLRQRPIARIWYYGPLFRYERPQKGRYRQFHQYGAECIGSPNPEADAEIILLAAQTLEAAGAQGVKLELNSLGTPESRVKYREALVEYFTKHKDSLSEDSQRRLDTNPLRILDSKNRDDRAIIASAPLLEEFLDDESAEHFATVKTLLDSAGLAYEVSPRLVRGLDYYSHTVFEFTSDALGSQSAVCGGGRYDPLFAMLGGGDVPAVGFSIGVERLLLVLEAQNEMPPAQNLDVFMCAFGDEARLPAQLIALRLRKAGLSVATDILRRSPKAQLKEADRSNARYALILGDDELAAQTVTVKDLHEGTQVSVEQASIVQHLASQ